MTIYKNDLEIIKRWDKEFVSLMDYVKKFWAGGWEENEGVYELTTDGLSENEQIINAMQENVLFWDVCWEESKRGGYYRFDLGFYWI